MNPCRAKPVLQYPILQAATTLLGRRRGSVGRGDPKFQTNICTFFKALVTLIFATKECKRKVLVFWSKILEESCELEKVGDFLKSKNVAKVETGVLEDKK